MGFDDEDMFRVLFIETSEVVFLGKRLSLPDVVAEVERIHPLARAESAKPGWDEPSEPPA
jgi:hypothetical protein